MKCFVLKRKGSPPPLLFYLFFFLNLGVWGFGLVPRQFQQEGVLCLQERSSVVVSLGMEINWKIDGDEGWKSVGKLVPEGVRGVVLGLGDGKQLVFGWKKEEKKDDEMSCKVQSGGMFNTYKTQYNPETHKLLKLLMDEVKMTTAMRQRMNESLKRGEPLPIITRRRYRPSYVDDNLFGLKKNYYFQRRTQSQIMHSGAYERERYRFLERTVDLEKEKEKLRNIMEYGKNKLKGKKAPTAAKKEVGRRVEKEITPEERLEELVCEVEDRLQFLREMESLKQSKAYEATIKQEIAGKLREMRKINADLADKYRSAIQPTKKTKNLNQESTNGQK